MMSAIVKLAYRQVIDRDAKPGFERQVFNDTFAELLLQAQVYNREQKFATVSEMILSNPKANSLHYKIGFAIGLYVTELNKKIPGLSDNLDRPVLFDIFKTEVVHADIRDQSSYRVAIHYITNPLMLVRSFGEYLVLAQPVEGDELETFTLALRPGLAVTYMALVPAHQDVWS